MQLLLLKKYERVHTEKLNVTHAILHTNDMLLLATRTDFNTI